VHKDFYRRTVTAEISLFFRSKKTTDKSDLGTGARNMFRHKVSPVCFQWNVQSKLDHRVISVNTKAVLILSPFSSTVSNNVILAVAKREREPG
jgi:hypothetical protein